MVARAHGSAAEAERAARAAAAHLAASPELAAARVAVLYAALPDELPSRAFYRAVRAAGVHPAFPRTRPDGSLEIAVGVGWERLVPGRYGVPEPPTSLPARGLLPGDLVLVPGVAFDRWGHRLGRGAGYWDRTLPERRPDGLVVVGVGFAWQLIEEVPHGPDDRRVDAVLTEAGWHRVREPSGP